MAEWLRRTARVIRASLFPVAIATVAGFVSCAGTLLTYDAAGAMGPLAPMRGWVLLPVLHQVAFLLIPPVTYAVATWRLGLRGALCALLGVVLLGPFLWSKTAWSSVNPEGRLGYYDETRGWIGFFLFVLDIGWFVVVPPITLLVRAAWRSSRRHSTGTIGR